MELVESVSHPDSHDEKINVSAQSSHKSQLKDDKQQLSQDSKPEASLEPYLIIIVHGIGSNAETQTSNLKTFQESFKKIKKGGFYDQKYSLEMKMVDWKTDVD